MLFVGRIQPLKAPDLAIRALAGMTRHRTALLVIVGGASGSDGDGEVESRRRLAAELGIADRVAFVPPQPHHILSSYYRAADLVIVPSRSESFGLVALEAAACGIPVVASAVGGPAEHRPRRRHRAARRRPRSRRASPGRSSQLLDDPAAAAAMGAAAAVRARRFTWSFTAARLRRLYTDLAAGRPRELVACS